MIYSTYYHVISIDRWGVDVASLATSFNSLSSEVGAIESDYVTSTELADATSVYLVATDSTTQTVLGQLGYDSVLVMTPMALGAMPLTSTNSILLCWMSGTSIEVGKVSFVGDIQQQAIDVYCRGKYSTASGVLGVDSAWTITANEVVIDGDGVSF